MKNSYELTVDIRKPNESYNIEFSQNSLNTSELIIRVVEDGKPFVLKDTDIIIVAFKTRSNHSTPTRRSESN